MYLSVCRSIYFSMCKERSIRCYRRYQERSLTYGAAFHHRVFSLSLSLSQTHTVCASRVLRARMFRGGCSGWGPTQGVRAGGVSKPDSALRAAARAPRRAGRARHALGVSLFRQEHGRVRGADAEEEEEEEEKEEKEGEDSFLTSVGDNSGHEGEEEREEEQAETKATATAEQANGVLDETDVHGGRETHLHDLHDLHVGLGLVIDKV